MKDIISAPCRDMWSYMGDHETIYELTEIPLDTLPDHVRAEVEAGKFVETSRELYGFLENYSS